MMQIREVVPEDRKDLLKILEATGVFKDYEIAVADEVIRDSMNPASGYYSRCCVNGENRAIGYVCWGPTPCTSGTYDLYWIAVHPDFQGHGIGKFLLNHVEEQVRKENVRLIIIETSSVNDYDATRRFYVQNGYQQFAIIPDFYRQGDHKIIYGKNFVP
jgi:ribosomal protein S18 acetylase RimI-like enzyme